MRFPRNEKSGSVQYSIKKLIQSGLDHDKHRKKQKEKLHGFIMIPKVQSDKSLDKEQSDLFPNFKYTIDQTYSNNDDVHIALLNDDKSYINNVNEFEMDNISKERYDNVSVLRNNLLENEDGGDQNDLVSWNSATLEKNWWSVCQLPVFIVLLAIIGVLGLTFVVILWLKSQMIQSKKNKKLVVLDRNQIQLSSSPCPCPCTSSSKPPEERWICHTVINLKNSSDHSDAKKAAPQPQEDGCVPKSLSGRMGDIKKRSEVVRVKAKGLLERRGSSASLTIDLPQSYDVKAYVVTPTQECTTEEFLLTAGNVLSRAQLKRCLSNVQSLHQEFWTIPLNHPEKSVVTGCGTKNRYQTILPNEKTRVKLSESEQHPLDAYINANYIRGYDGEEKAYIATQGPLPNTVQDLYRMAWNERSPIIVMITKFFEKTKVKCECYFPTEVGAAATYGAYRVTTIRFIKKQGFSVRELLIQNGIETRRILHYWYDSWPDHETPQDPDSIVAMAAEIEKCRGRFRNKSLNYNDSRSDSCGPVIVHCSAGIGRTGCFIAISLAISQLLEEDKVDILGIVCQIRRDRGGMIQTAEQYEFVHKAVALFERSLPQSNSRENTLLGFP